MVKGFRHFCKGARWIGEKSTIAEVRTYMSHHVDCGRDVYIHRALLKDPNENLIVWGDFYQITQGVWRMGLGYVDSKEN